MQLEYTDIQLLLKLENRDGINDENSCFDHVSFIHYDDKDMQWSVCVFIEPVGDITIKGNKLSNVLEFWIEVFRSQPLAWGYAKAGFHLDKYLQSSLFHWVSPIDAKKIWEIGGADL